MLQKCPLLSRETRKRKEENQTFFTSRSRLKASFGLKVPWEPATRTLHHSLRQRKELLVIIRGQCLTRRRKEESTTHPPTVRLDPVHGVLLSVAVEGVHCIAPRLAEIFGPSNYRRMTNRLPKANRVKLVVPQKKKKKI